MVRLFTYENLTVLAWYSAPTAVVIEELFRLGEPVRRRYPRGGSIVHVMRGERLSIMDGAARDAMVRVSNEVGSTTAGVAMVLGADGFLASMIRSVVTGLRVRSKHNFDYRMHARCEEVLEWLPSVHRAKTGVSLDPDQLLSVLQRAQASSPSIRL
jgi:hypothetical protein